jgi:inosose dehydratase
MVQTRIGYTTVTWAVKGSSTWLEDGISDIASLGFKGVETFSHTAEEYDRGEGKFRALLDKHQTQIVCLDKIRSYYQDAAQRDDIVVDHERSARFLVAHGGEILMTVPRNVPDNAPRWSLDEFKIVAATMDEIGRRALDVGAKMALHPHWGTYIESAEEIDIIMELTDPRYVFFAPDSGQIAKGDADPVAVARKYQSRIAHVHLKDVASNWNELRRMGTELASPLGYAPLGQGLVDLRGFLGVLAEGNYQGWIMGELDRYEDPKAGAEIGRRFLVEDMHYAL